MKRRPIPADFRLTEADLEKARLVAKSLVVLSLAWMVIGIGIGWYLNKSGHRDFAAFFTVLAIPPWGPLLFHWLAKTAARRLIPVFGRTIAYEDAVREYQQWWVRTQTEFWGSLSGRAFEVELANLFRRHGFEAQVTTAETDKGVDIWISKDGKRLPVQCKAHKRPVTPGAARELYGTMKHFGASDGVLASVSGFTRGVGEYASGKGIQLVDLPAILELQRRLE